MGLEEKWRLRGIELDLYFAVLWTLFSSSSLHSPSFLPPFPATSYQRPFKAQATIPTIHYLIDANYDVYIPPLPSSLHLILYAIPTSQSKRPFLLNVISYGIYTRIKTHYIYLLIPNGRRCHHNRMLKRRMMACTVSVCCVRENANAREKMVHWRETLSLLVNSDQAL